MKTLFIYQRDCNGSIHTQVQKLASLIQMSSDVYTSLKMITTTYNIPFDTPKDLFGQGLLECFSFDEFELQKENPPGTKWVVIKSSAGDGNSLKLKNIKFNKLLSLLGACVSTSVNTASGKTIPSGITFIKPFFDIIKVPLY